MQKINPCLWFDGNAEEAVKFYASVFKNSKIGQISRYGEAGFEFHGKPAGTVMTIEFELNGYSFLALNGDSTFKFSEAISFQVNCETQEEIEYYWDKLSQGGDPNAQACGWLKDKYGLSWQIVPAIMPKLIQEGNNPKSERVMNAMLKMKKIDIEALKRASQEQK